MRLVTSLFVFLAVSVVSLTQDAAAADAASNKTLSVRGVPRSIDVEFAAGLDGDEALARGVYVFRLKCSADVSCGFQRIALNECSDKEGATGFAPEVDYWTTWAGMLKVEQRSDTRIELTVYQAFGGKLPAKVVLTFASASDSFDELVGFEATGFLDHRKWPDLNAQVAYVAVERTRRKVLDCPVVLHGIAPAVAEVVNDPLFNIDYDPRQVHFDSVQTKDLLPTCKRDLASLKPLPPSLTLYAQYFTGSTRIYIAGAGEDIGIYVIRAGRCDSGIPILALLKKVHHPPEPQDSPVLSDSEVSGVFADALVRYARAFGGKKRFFDWVDATTERVLRLCPGSEDLCSPTYRTFTPALRTALDDFRNGSE